MSTTATGRAAEDAAADYLRGHGYKIVERNFKTAQCEIDIIAQKDKRLYFVEVKYRRRESQGSGLEYVTRQKQQQMTRAAETWLYAHVWNGEIVLSAIELAADFEVTNFIESIY